MFPLPKQLVPDLPITTCLSVNIFLCYLLWYRHYDVARVKVLTGLRKNGFSRHRMSAFPQELPRSHHKEKEVRVEQLRHACFTCGADVLERGGGWNA